MWVGNRFITIILIFSYNRFLMEKAHTHKPATNEKESDRPPTDKLLMPMHRDQRLEVGTGRHLAQLTLEESGGGGIRIVMEAGKGVISEKLLK